MTSLVVGAVFDMNGLLVDTEKLSQASYRHASEAVGLLPSVTGSRPISRRRCASSD